MKFEKLEGLAREMSAAEAEATLRSLAADARLAAVVRVVLEQRELAADGACTLQFANNHGCLAHASGVRYGMNELLGRIRQACEPPKRRGERESGPTRDDRG